LLLNYLNLRFVIPIVVFLFVSIGSVAQESTADSTTVAATKEDVAKTKKKPDTKKEKKKDGFGDTLLSLGKGFLERLKYRFNLEAVEQKVQKTQKKFKKKEDKDRKEQEEGS